MANEDTGGPVAVVSNHELDDANSAAIVESSADAPLSMTGEAEHDTEEAGEANQIKVSSNRNAYFYVDLATRFLRDMDDVELSGLGYACTTVCTVAEILKAAGIAVVTRIFTCTVDVKDIGHKAKMLVVLTKGPKYNDAVAAAAAAREARNADAHEQDYDVNE